MVYSVIVDDQDVKSINYGDTPNLWKQFTQDDDALMGTTTEGATGAKACLTFSGTAVAVYGFADTPPNGAGPTLQLSVDGVVWSTTIPANSVSEHVEIQFFNVDGLSSAEHVLEFTVVDVSYTVALDYFAYEPLNGSDASTAASVQPQVVTSFFSASQQIVTTYLPAPSDANASTPPSHTPSSGLDVGAIVGGAVGGVAVLVAGAIAVYFLYFRHRRDGRPYFYSKPGRDSGFLDEEVKPPPYELPAAVPCNPKPELQDSVTTRVARNTPHSTAPPNTHDAGKDCSPGSPTSSGSADPPPLNIDTNSAASGDSPHRPVSKAAEAGLLLVSPAMVRSADTDTSLHPSEGESSSAAGVTKDPAAAKSEDAPPAYAEG